MDKNDLKEYHRENYKNNKETINARNKTWKEKNKEKQRGYYQKWKKNNLEKLRRRKKKRYYLHKLIVDKIIVDFYNGKSISPYPIEAKQIFCWRIVRKIKIPSGQLCKQCGVNLAKEKHHKDYNHPLDVDFLCVECHLKLKE